MGKINCISHVDLTPDVIQQSKLDGSILAVHYPVEEYLPDILIKEQLGVHDSDYNVVIHQDITALPFSIFKENFNERELHMKFV